MNRRALRLAPLAAILLASGVAAVLSPARAEHLDPLHAFELPSSEHPLGRGEAGIDLLAVLANAELRAIALAVIVSLAGLAIGAPLGAAAALLRGRFERACARACDLVQAFPTFLLAMAVLAAVRTPDRIHIGLVFTLTSWAPFARLALAETSILRSAAFVEAAHALGVGPVRVLVRHVLPNIIGILAVQLGSTAAAIVVSEAALAFVGFGPRSGVSLGAVLDQGVAAMLRAPHVLGVGAACVMLTSGALLLAGRAAEPEGG